MNNVGASTERDVLIKRIRAEVRGMESGLGGQKWSTPGLEQAVAGIFLLGKLLTAAADELERRDGPSSDAEMAKALLRAHDDDRYGHLIRAGNYFAQIEIAKKLCENSPPAFDGLDATKERSSKEKT